MSTYCELADLYDYGVPAGGIPNPGRVLSASNATTNLFTLDNHGFRSNAELTFRAEAGGARARLHLRTERRGEDPAHRQRKHETGADR